MKYTRFEIVQCIVLALILMAIIIYPHIAVCKVNEVNMIEREHFGDKGRELNLTGPYCPVNR